MIPVLIGGIIGFALTESDRLLKKASWKVWMILIVTTVVFALLLPLIDRQRIIQGISQVLMIIFINILLEKKINKILAFVIALIAGTIWAVWLISLVGVIYGG